MDDLPRIVMVLDSVFPALGGGGSESQVRTLSLRLMTLGVPVTVVVPGSGTPGEPSADTVDGIAVRRIQYPHVRWLGALILQWRFAWWLFMHRDAYSAIHAHIGGNMAAVAALVGRWLGKPVLVKMAGEVEFAGGVTSRRPTFSGRVRRWWLRSASHLQATSTRIAAALKAGGFDPERICVIPNAVDVQRFAAVARDEPLRRQWGGEGVRFVGVYVGRLEVEKDPELMVRAWAGAFQGDPTRQLVIVGTGTLQPALEALAAQLGISACIVFAGGSREVERFNASADVGLLPSRSEGLSNTLLEYMAAGLPVVGTRVSGTEDFVVTGRNGWLIESGDLAAFIHALQEAAALTDGERHALGRQARATVASRASLDAVLDRLMAIYQSNQPAKVGVPASHRS
jgi:L-malate glycosyltransferase